MAVCDFYSALKNYKLIDIIDKYVENGGDINACWKSTGLLAGYTVLHLAAMDGYIIYVRVLIYNYGADVNSVGEDGAQPIHLACFSGYLDVASNLLDFGANPNSEFDKSLYDKYARRSKYINFKEISFDEFGGKMTLLTFSVINNKQTLMKYLLKHRANIWIKSTKNKTLLMYAIEHGSYNTAQMFVLKMENHPTFINARDNNGWQAVHYFLCGKKYGQHQSDIDSSIKNDQASVLCKLIHAGADINATINGDPKTLLINMAAYRCNEQILRVLLNFDVPLSATSKALHYVNFPVNSKDFTRHETRKLILECYTFRRNFGLFVPKEEIKLMDKLVSEDDKVKKIVKDYQDNFINRTVKNTIVHLGNQSTVTMYNLAVEILDDKKLKLLVKDNSFVKAYTQFYEQRNLFNGNIIMVSLITAMYNKIIESSKRRKLLEIVERIEDLRKAIPLPYELTLTIIEFVDNRSLARFVNAFFKNPISAT